MGYPVKTLLAFGFIVLIAASATAQSRQQTLREIDSNGDGLLQFTELQTFRERAFDGLDTNANGLADPSELEALRARAVGAGRQGDPTSFDPYASDANGDGVITRQEFIAYIPPRMLAADRDADGALSRAELRALR